MHYQAMTTQISNIYVYIYLYNLGWIKANTYIRAFVLPILYTSSGVSSKLPD